MLAGSLVLALIAGGGYWLKREEAAAVRREIGLLEEELARLTQLESERTQLKSSLPATAEIERLRSDRAAVVRLRAEVEELRSRLEKRAGR